ncbi:MAG: hypothetical protein NW216_00290 [Hyphomicrobium sp.]|nr:hypothetical protein [Hyphomicrobium sp.]
MSGLGVLTGLVLAAAVMLGGGTRTGYVGDVIAQLLAVVLLMVLVWQVLCQRESRRRAGWFAILLTAAVLAIGAVQLFPGAGMLASGNALRTAWLSELGLAGLDVHWAQLSLVPHATWAALCSFLVPVAIFAGCAGLGRREREVLATLLLVLAGVSLGIGFIQMAQGPDSPWRLFEITNRNDAVGVFANRNHFAALLYVGLLLAAFWFAARLDRSLAPNGDQRLAVVWAGLALSVLLAIIGGLAMARSRAGILLAMAALVGILLMAASNRRRAARLLSGGKSDGWGRWAVITGLVAVLFVAQLGLHRILNRFDVDPLEDRRIPFAVTTYETALQELPFGAGLGSFVPVYAAVEKKADVFAFFGNRAHNDVVEFLLEGGIVAALLMGALLVWFVRRILSVWFRAEPGDSAGHVMLQRCASLIVLLLLVHSLIDYPLRTTALAATFALALGLLTRPPQHIGGMPDLKEPIVTSPTPEVAVAPTKPVQERRPWQGPQQWPDSWKGSKTSEPDDA